MADETKSDSTAEKDNVHNKVVLESARDDEFGVSSGAIFVPPKKNVIYSALVGGLTHAAFVGMPAGFLNAEVQGSNGFNWKPMRDEFTFNTKSFHKWVIGGLAVGFVGGAIISTIGAINHNNQVDNFVAREQNRKQPAEVSQGM